MTLPVRQETVIVSGSGTSVNLAFASTPNANDLILVGVHLRNESIAPSLSGYGATYVQVHDIDNTQGQCGVNVFRALKSSYSAGSITVTLTGNAGPVYVIASRYSGAETGGTDGSGAMDATGSDAGPATDNANMKASVTTATADALIVAFATSRTSPTFTVPGGQTSVSINNTEGAGGDLIKAHHWGDDAVTTGAYTLGSDGDLSAAADWCVALIAIKPAPSGVTVTPAAAVLALASQAPAVELGSVIVLPDAAIMALLAIAPVVADAIVPAPAVLALALPDPTLEFSSLVMTPAAAVLAMAPQAPTLEFGSVVVLPGGAVLVLIGVAPTVVLSSAVLVHLRWRSLQLHLRQRPRQLHLRKRL